MVSRQSSTHIEPILTRREPASVVDLEDTEQENRPKRRGNNGNRKRKGRRQKSPKGEPAPVVIRPVAGSSRSRPRHWGVLFSFILFVMLPVGGLGYYLYTYAVDQFASNVGFSVRTEEAESSFDVLSVLGGTSNNSSRDTDILYEFIQSQTLATKLETQLSLTEKWSKPENDPVFAYDASGTIEDLMRYWGRMVRINYDASTGLIELKILAFDPNDAQEIAQAIFAESSKMINDLSAIARDDATQYARDELELTETRLKTARLAISEFRERTQIVDPKAVIQGQTGLVTNLEAQLAETLIELDLLLETASNNDPRIKQAELKVQVIQERIRKEKEKFSNQAGSGNEGFSALVSEYENLTVELNFAEQAYLAALSGYDGALGQARRQTRYLAPHARPTLAERAEYPQRLTILGIFTFFSLMAWMIGVLIYYTIKDRR